MANLNEKATLDLTKTLKQQERQAADNAKREMRKLANELADLLSRMEQYGREDETAGYAFLWNQVGTIWSIAQSGTHIAEHVNAGAKIREILKGVEFLAERTAEEQA